MRRVQLRRGLLHAAMFVATIATALVFACGDPYAESAEPPPEQEAGTPDTAPAQDVTPPSDPCGHVVPPGPPLVDDAPGEELPPFFVAVRTVSLANAKGQGFDLDGVCTCDPRPSTAHDGGGSCGSKQPSCDLDGGIDNSVAVLTSQFSPFFAVDTIPNRLISDGRRTLLVQIGKYNGRANDKEVAVGLAMSDGIREQGCPTSMEDVERGVWTPGWCADERWSFVPDAVLPTTKQPLIQGVGYVTAGVITLQLPSLLVPFNETSALNVGSAIITGSLVPLGEDLNSRDRDKPPTEKEKRLWAINGGVVAGRLKALDLLVAMGTVDRKGPDGGGRVYLCEESQFLFARNSVCEGVDIAATKALDFDPGAKCDSLSIALTYTAFPALPGDVRALTPAYNPCTPGPNGQPPDAGSADPPYRCP